MTDPFEKLRGTGAEAAPDLGAIRGRARRIEQRRRLAVGASAASVAAVALIAVMIGVGTNERPRTDLALEDRDIARQEASEGGAMTGSADAVTEPKAPKAVTGSRSTESQSSAGAGGTAAGSVGADGAPAAAMSTYDEPLTAQVVVEGRPLGGADLTLVVCNATKETVTKEFGDAQRYDFLIEEADESTEVWQWSEGQMFAQVVGSETWKPEECREWTDSWDEMETGSYRVTAWLTSDPPVRSKRVAFCTGLC